MCSGHHKAAHRPAGRWSRQWARTLHRVCEDPSGGRTPRAIVRASQDCHNVVREPPSASWIDCSAAPQPSWRSSSSRHGKRGRLRTGSNTTAEFPRLPGPAASGRRRALRAVVIGWLRRGSPYHARRNERRDRFGRGPLSARPLPNGVAGSRSGSMPRQAP